MTLHKLCKHSSVDIHPQSSLSFKMKSLQHKPASNLTIFLPQPPPEYLALQVSTTRPGYKGFFLVSSLIWIQNVLPIPFFQSMPILDPLHCNLQLFNSKVAITCNCVKYTFSKEIISLFAEFNPQRFLPKSHLYSHSFLKDRKYHCYIHNHQYITLKL